MRNLFKFFCPSFWTTHYFWLECLKSIFVLRLSACLSICFVFFLLMSRRPPLVRKVFCLFRGAIYELTFRAKFSLKIESLNNKLHSSGLDFIPSVSFSLYSKYFDFVFSILLPVV